VVNWTPDNNILYTTRYFSTLPNYQLVVLDPDNRTHMLIPLAQAVDGSYDDSDSTLFFTRLSFQGSNAKRYKGGTAQNIWKFAPGTPEAIPLTQDYAGTSKRPMWWNGRVYFASDRDGTMNIWSMNVDGTDFEQHTDHDGWDIKDPALSEGRIVYQIGADLHVFDIGTDNDRKLSITLTSDLDQLREHWVQDPMNYLTSVHLSPKGDRIALTSRGEVFVAPVKHGRFVEVTRNPNVRYRQARFMPDGQSLIALSDESGEVEWWKLSPEGLDAPEQLTDDGKVIRFDGLPSPDGKWMVHHNHDYELWLLNMETGESREVATSPTGRFGQGYAFSPDSRWLVYAMSTENDMTRLFLYNIENGSTVALTTDRFDSWDPAWSPDGKWLYFLSNRHFQTLVGSPWGARQPDPFFDQQTLVFAISLEKDEKYPFRPADELSSAKEDSTDQKTESATTKIDLDGIQTRLYQLPVDPGNYSSLSINDKRLFWISRETSRSRSRHLFYLDIGKVESSSKKWVEDVGSYELSHDGKKVLVRKRNNLYVIDASAGAPAALADKSVNLSNWTFPVRPREEWQQIFVDAWRLHRDYFYDRNMHGVNWPAMLEKYRPLVSRVTNREELSDLQAQMVSELSALHSNVRNGDVREGPDQITPASLGAKLERDNNAGGYRISHIYRSDPDIPEELSPLAQPGVKVREGDVIEAINGTPLLSVVDLGVLLRNQAGKQVRLRINPGDGEANDVIVTAISQGRAYDLRYDEWEYTRRLLTDSLSHDDIGYVHLRAMGGGNMAEWEQHFYPVFNRSGLVIDVRHNRGGNIDSWILGKLLRKAWFYWQGRSGNPYWNMQYAFRGHMVVLVNEWTASDGEAFAEGFRRLGLGKVIGTRTWGGEIWLSSGNVQVDRGIARAAETGVYGPEREWLIEGHGVDPDIIVDNLPHATFNGEDTQLKAAIEHLQELIRNDPRPVPPPPPHPDLSVPSNRK